MGAKWGFGANPAPIMVPTPALTEEEAATPPVLTAAQWCRPAHHHCLASSGHKHCASTEHEPRKAPPQPCPGNRHGGQCGGGATLIRGVSAWQSSVEPPRAWPAAFYKQPLRFPAHQAPETIRKNETQENPGLLEGETHGPLAGLSWPPKMSTPGSKEGQVAVDSLRYHSQPASPSKQSPQRSLSALLPQNPGLRSVPVMPPVHSSRQRARVPDTLTQQQRQLRILVKASHMAGFLHSLWLPGSSAIFTSAGSYRMLHTTTLSCPCPLPGHHILF